MAGEIGPWTDLYSVGILTYELILGSPPFTDADSPLAILMRHVNERAPSPIELQPTLDPGLSAWIDSLLVKDPRDRVRHALDAWESLEEIIVRLIGPLWRRDARLLSDQADAVEADPLTPAPFESHVSIRTPTPQPGAFITFRPGAKAQPEPSPEPERAPEPEPEPEPEPVPEPQPEPERPAPEPEPVLAAEPEPEPEPEPRAGARTPAGTRTASGTRAGAGQRTAAGARAATARNPSPPATSGQRARRRAGRGDRRGGRLHPRARIEQRAGNPGGAVADRVHGADLDLLPGRVAARDGRPHRELAQAHGPDRTRPEPGRRWRAPRRHRHRDGPDTAPQGLRRDPALAPSGRRGQVGTDGVPPLPEPTAPGRGGARDGVRAAHERRHRDCVVRRPDGKRDGIRRGMRARRRVAAPQVRRRRCR